MISLGDKEITSDPTKKRKFVAMYSISNRMYGIVVFVHIMAVNLNYYWNIVNLFGAAGSILS